MWVFGFGQGRGGIFFFLLSTLKEREGKVCKHLQDFMQLKAAHLTQMNATSLVLHINLVRDTSYQVHPYIPYSVIHINPHPKEKRLGPLGCMLAHLIGRQEFLCQCVCAQYHIRSRLMAGASILRLLWCWIITIALHSEIAQSHKSHLH